MSEIFIVKVDLSSIIHDENEKLYVLMVDPGRMKMIFQFKLWIRFLFSIQCSIKLLYEDAVIHDMEDIHILNLLKTVRVEHMYYGVGEKKHLEELVAKVNIYDEWHESVLPVKTPQKHRENGDGFLMPSSNIQETGVSRVESMINSSIERCGRTNENAVRYSVCSGSQTVTKNKSGVISNNLNTSSNSCSFNGDDTVISDYHNKTSEIGIDSQKDKCLNEVPYNTPKITNESGKTNSCNIKQKSSFRASTNKPFSLYNFLQSLKSQETKTENGQVLENDVQLENIEFKASEVKLEEKIGSFVEDGEGNVTKRKRKRVRRKPRDKQNKIFSQQSITLEPVNSLIRDKQINKSVNISPKPKHIRFDTDEEESRDNELGKPVQYAINVVNESNECVYNTEVTKSSDQEVAIESDQKLQSTQQGDFVNEGNNVIAATIEVDTDTHVNEVDICNQVMTGDGNEVKNDSPQRILDILGSLKNKGSTPPVFNRFVNYM